MAPLRKYPAWVEKLLAQRQPGNQGFTPYDLQTAPPGSYDPALDYQAENEQLGYMFGGQDFELGRGRLDTDYNDQLTDIGRQEGRGLADLLQARQFGQEDYDLGGSRRAEDFGTARQRAGEDYGLQRQDLGLQYQRLGNQQTERARASGLGEGGALVQALRKRTENQGRDQGRLDLGFQRQTSDLDRSESRSTEDASRQYQRFMSGNDLSRARLGEDAGQQRYGALKGYQRGGTDLETGWQRQGLAHELFQGQLNRQKLWQASQTGGLPAKPSNEFSDAKGPYRVEIHGKQRWKRRPDGSYEVVR